MKYDLVNDFDYVAINTFCELEGYGNCAVELYESKVYSGSYVVKCIGDDFELVFPVIDIPKVFGSYYKAIKG